MKSASFFPCTSPVELRSATPCPLNHGLAVLDQLLAAITREDDAAALDVVLDFRLLLASSNDADTILREFFRVRQIVEDRHYLACFRLRRWLETEFLAEVKLDRTRPARQVALRLDAASYRALCARCAFDAAEGELLTAWVRVQFTSVISQPATTG